MEDTPHIPVLREQVVQLLNPQPGATYFDGTAGYGGHAAQILAAVGPTGRAILVDRDEQAITALHQRFDSQPQLPQLQFVHSDYLEAARQLQTAGTTVDMALLDLGVSSPQLDVAERGFSFTLTGPLDMRMDASASDSGGQTAADIVNQTSEQQLADLIYAYGEDRKSRRIAHAIVQHRPITTTTQLAEVVAVAIGRHEDIHPATRTFQALRIAVNAELEQLQTALPILAAILNTGGRLVVISFHSLEDRIVKEFLRRQSRDCICPPEQPICTCDHHASLRVLTKKPVTAADEPPPHDCFNPRARSAKLRAAEKLTPKPKETA